MDIKEIAKEMIREKFIEKLENDNYGWTGNGYSCPQDIGILDFSDKCSELSGWPCPNCWEQAIKDIKFKGEDVK